MSETGVITLYGNTWCGGSRRARLFFESKSIAYVFIDIDKDEAAAKVVEGLANGFRSVPTIVMADGSVLVEPSQEELAKKLGVKI
jgi:glutaredoxin